MDSNQSYSMLSPTRSGQKRKYGGISPHRHSLTANKRQKLGPEHAPRAPERADEREEMEDEDEWGYEQEDEEEVEGGRAGGGVYSDSGWGDDDDDDDDYDDHDEDEEGGEDGDGRPDEWDGHEDDMNIGEQDERSESSNPVDILPRHGPRREDPLDLALSVYVNTIMRFQIE